MRSLNRYKNNVSARIINIATLSVTIGISTILIALSVSKGLQQEIETKQILGLVTSNREAKKEYEFNASQRDNENPLRIIDNNIIWNVEKSFRY